MLLKRLLNCQSIRSLLLPPCVINTIVGGKGFFSLHQRTVRGQNSRLSELPYKHLINTVIWAGTDTKPANNNTILEKVAELRLKQRASKKKTEQESVKQNITAPWRHSVNKVESNTAVGWYFNYNYLHHVSLAEVAAISQTPSMER